MSKKNRFYIDGNDFKTGDRVTLNKDESHHLTRVLRFNEEETVEIFDGNGGLYKAQIEDIGETTTLCISDVLTGYTDPKIEVTLIQSIPKKADMDVVVRMGTEIGISTFIPLLSERTEIYSQNRLSDKQKRWRRISIAACKQCGRNELPEIRNPFKPEEIFDIDADLKLILEQNKKTKNFQSQNSKAESIVLAAGPEGGWKKSELRLAEESGFEYLSLGKRVLRAKTAGIVAGALIQNKFGDLKESNHRKN